MEIMKKIQINKMNKMKVISLITLIISLPIIIALFANYANSCKVNLVRVNYDISINPEMCYCQSSVTGTNILNQLLKNDYAAQLIDSTTLRIDRTKWFYDFAEYASQVFYITSIPAKILRSYGNYSILLSGIYSITISANSWQAQFDSMRISQFVLSTSPSYQIPIAVTYQNPMTNAIIIFTLNADCESEAHEWIVISYGTKVTGMAFPNGVCLYLRGSTIYNNITDFCLNDNCTKLIEFGMNITNAIKEDLEQNVFSIKPVSYCKMDYCLQSQCFGLGLFQTLLLAVSCASTTFVVTKTFVHMYLLKKKNKNNRTEIANTELTIV
jgi:hypothetical protein